MTPKIIDTHIHVWDFEQAEYAWLKGNTSLLHRTYSIAELESERFEAGISGGILVQAANNFEDTNWMLSVAECTPWIEGVVGWMPLTEPDATEKALAHYLQNPYFKGVRHLIHDEPDATWLLQDTVIESLKLLAENDIPYDVVGVLPAHIKTAMKVAEKVPNLRMVFDHLSQPPIAAGERFGEWGTLMSEAAQHRNFYAKISGLGTASGNVSGWTASDLGPYVSFTLEQFGAGRCLCGGDWPVSLLAGDYVNTWNAYQSLLSKLLSEDDQQKVYAETAQRFYGLNIEK